MRDHIQGRALKYGDNINTDIISPPAGMELSIKEAARYAMSPVDPDFATTCRPGDILVAGRNLGSGSSRETAPLLLYELGIRVVVAMSFARIFYRNCINLGILALECEQTDRIAMLDELEIDYANGVIRDRTNSEVVACQPVPHHMMPLIEAGGLVAYLQSKREKVH